MATDGFNPDTGSGDAVRTVNETASGGTGTEDPQTIMGAVNEIFSIVSQNQEIVLFLVLLAGVGYFAYKKYDGRASSEEYEGKDWGKIIPSDMKYMLNNAGMDVEKDLTRGDTTDLGTVVKYDTFRMPEDVEYQELLFGEIDEDDLEDAESKEVYVFMVAPEGDIGQAMWKVTDIWFNLDMQTKLFVVDADKVDEELKRFKLDEDIDFKREYGSIMMQKGVSTENVTDQFPLYQARKNVVEGLEEFSMKTLFLDRTHASAVAQMREDVDEEAIKKLLNQGKNF